MPIALHEQHTEFVIRVLVKLLESKLRTSLKYVILREPCVEASVEASVAGSQVLHGDFRICL
jgi:hypothetical protein